MMNFSTRDMAMTTAMVMAIIFMSFTFPALGLTGDEANESNIPELNVSTDRFDFAPEVERDDPGTSFQQTLEFDTELAGDSDNVWWILGSTDGGREVVLTNGNASTPENPQPRITVNNWTDGSLEEQEQYNFTDVGDVHEHTAFEPELRFVLTSLEIDDEANESTFEVDVFTITEVDQDSFIVARAVGDFTDVVYWVTASVVQMFLNAVGAIFDMTVFILGLLVWLTSTYADIIAGANSWAAVFVAIPGVIFSLLFMKMMVVAISLLPTT